MLAKLAVILIFLGLFCTFAVKADPKYKSIDIRGFADGINHWDNKNPNDPRPRYSLNQIELIADNILRYQRANGGWPENINLLRIMSEQDIEQQAELFNSTDTSFDNRNVYPQIRYLADAYQQTRKEKYKDAVIRGLHFILTSQLDNGGFTHSPPTIKYYFGHITIMDDVTVGVLGLLQEIKLGGERFGFLPVELTQKLSEAYNLGDALLLRLQVKIDGRLAIWAGQYDAQTLQPTRGRPFEPPALVSSESVDVVRYLMSDPEPSVEKRQAITSAVRWFKEAALTGIDLVRIEAEPVRFEYHSANWDLVIVESPDSPPIWARFYDLNSNSPVLANRAGQRVNSLAELSRERRTGYAWYGRWPQTLLSKEYEKWRADNTAQSKTL